MTRGRRGRCARVIAFELPCRVAGCCGIADGNDVQVAICTPPTLMSSDLPRIFPSLPMGSRVSVVTVMQKASEDLVQVTSAVALEKDRLLRHFFDYATALCNALSTADSNCFVDFVDPCSGLPVNTERGGAIYDEVESAQSLLKMQTSSVGCCSILHHPQWGTRVYPGMLVVL
ncbi:hypothetical protein PBRA_005361 [Plasmodiophora brassicae]|uniref:Uncharacterized protein n=1 Tax=Plasmodiophora brassicae TaxID=37360 RepID=A0A0G4INJ1_PLABS|nr:hypothetical protein PBRA_005361 [Plasmodiophora brassicae]